MFNEIQFSFNFQNLTLLNLFIMKGHLLKLLLSLNHFSILELQITVLEL